MTKPRKPKKIAHGTYGGSQLHRRRGEDVCDPCKKAAAEYLRQYRKSRPDKYAAERARNDARGRALTRLAARHQVEFAAIYEEERGK